MAKKKFIIGMVLVLACGLTGCRQAPSIVWEDTADSIQIRQTERESESMTGNMQQETISAESTDKAVIMVDICGAVVHPGVYELEEGARVCDVIACAGGLLSDADRKTLNQAALLHDADKVIVYTYEEIQAGAGDQLSGENSGTGHQGKVNINTADAEELCTLKGIGESRARDIIAYRTSNGAFQTIEEIMNVNGIKEATYSGIKDYISVG
ncbi:MAG: helix-hairpin-helix domain-containing protein [Eubacteriales bacterium]|nr:helix-hairpin-helix domain-containing protein [Eubacteriales bacterium]